MRRLKIFVSFVIAAMVLAGCASTTNSRAKSEGYTPTALDEYVYTPDPNYNYEVKKTVDGEGYTAHIIRMTSQHYLTEKEIDQVEWWHWLTVVVPDNLTSDTALLWIGGSDNDAPMPEEPDGHIVQLALGSSSVVAQLRMVPNQPLVFMDDPTKRERKEDSIIAYTWDKFMRTGDTKWPLRLPMTKSATAAMDTIEAELGDAGVSKFVVAGGSKRGWTTWTTGAVDNRVVAIMPIVIDLLNTEESFKHHWEVYGFWAPAVGDYVEQGTMDWMGSPENDALYNLVEPFAYRERYTMPKFLINATGDQFFLPDSSQFYWDELIGEKHIRYVPNGDHGLDETDALNSVLAFFHAIVHDVERPSFTWKVEDDDSIRVWTVEKPAQVNLWHASNTEARDFRVETIGKVWESTELTDQGGGVYVGKVNTPEKGWTAFFVELVYESGAEAPFKFTTEVHVVPRTLPFKYEAPTWPEGGYIRSQN